MELKAEWLNSRKQQIIAQLTECQLQSKEIIGNLIESNESKSKEIIGLKQAHRISEDNYKEDISKYLIQIKTFQNLIITKEGTIESLKSQNARLSNANEERGANIQLNYTKILQLQHLLSVQKQQGQRKRNDFLQQLESERIKYFEQISKLKREFENEINQKQNSLIQSYQEELNSIKKVNTQIIQKIENQHQMNSNKSSQSNKQAEVDNIRLVSENTKLLSTVNQNKMKILTLQSSLNSQQQQTKLLQKEIEILKENNKRENTFLKEEKSSMAEKNRRLTEKIDELSWIIRENELKKDQDMKRMRKDVDKSFQEISQKALEENRRLQDTNEKIKKELQQKSQELQQMHQITLKTKELNQAQDKQIQQLKEQKQSLQRETKAVNESNTLKLNEDLKNEIVRKNCEIQVLQDEIKRLKNKINTTASAQQQYLKHKEVIEKQNKMLLSEIIFLRDKEKKGKNKMQDSKMSKSNFLSEMNSEQSKDYEDIEQYKKLIQFMTDEMNDVSKKIIQKDMKIEKLQALVKRYERELKDLK